MTWAERKWVLWNLLVFFGGFGTAIILVHVDILRIP